MDDDVASAVRAEAELVAAQLAAIEQYNRIRRGREQALATAAETRELQLEARRRLDAIRREHSALLARAEEALRTTGRPMGIPAPRAVVAHRQEWMRTRVGTALEEQGVAVLACVDDGADASAAVVFEQPDIVFLEDRLPSLAGIEVVERARQLAPRAVVGVQLLDDRDAAMFTEAQAVVFSRRVPPAEVAQRLLERVGDAADGGLALV